jgi:hypothetical protein
MSRGAIVTALIGWGVLSLVMIALQLSEPVKSSALGGSLSLFLAVTATPLLLWLALRACSAVERYLRARQRGTTLPWLAEYLAEKSWGRIAANTVLLGLCAFFIPIWVSSCLRVRDEQPVLVAIAVAEVLILVGVPLFFSSGRSRLVTGPLRLAVQLRKAAGAGNARAVKTLVAHGADPGTRDRFGWTPMYFAARRGRTGMMATLEAAGGTIDAVARRLLEDYQKAERAWRIEEARLKAEAEEARRQEEAGRKMAAESVGICAICQGYVHRLEPYYVRRDRGIEPMTFPFRAMVHYDVPIAVYHKACAEQADLV